MATVRRAGFELDGEEFTEVPSGFAKDHPRAELLKYRTMTASRDFGAPDWLSTAAAGDRSPRAGGRSSRWWSWLRAH